MKKLILIALLSACSKVPAGHVGVKVYLLGTNKGVDNEVLGVGRYWIGVNEQLFVFPTFQQNYVWTKSPHEGSPNDESITFQTREGMSINVDMGISYSLDATKVAFIFQKYRRGIEEITDTFMRNAVRDAINEKAVELSVEEAYSTKKVELLKSVEAQLKALVGPIGINVDKVFIVGSMRLPEGVFNALNSKIEATQKAMQTQNEIIQAQATAAKEIAIAKGTAEANRIKQASLSDLLIRYEALQKWDGKLPAYFGSSGQLPFVQLR